MRYAIRRNGRLERLFLGFYSEKETNDTIDVCILTYAIEKMLIRTVL